MRHGTRHHGAHGPHYYLHGHPLHVTQQGLGVSDEQRQRSYQQAAWGEMAVRAGRIADGPASRAGDAQGLAPFRNTPASSRRAFPAA
jgi:hypothetical protein